MPARFPLPLSDVLLRRLRPHPEGLRIRDLRYALRPIPPAQAVENALRQLCQQGLAVRVGRGRYTLTSAFRTLDAAVEARQA